MVVWENAKVTTDPQPAVGGRQTEDFLSLRHETNRPARGEAILHHAHAGKKIVGGSRGLKVRERHHHHGVLRNGMIDGSEVRVHLRVNSRSATDRKSTRLNSSHS